MVNSRAHDGSAHARLSIGAVLLAAGAGSRLGGRPKSLLELDGVPLIRRQLTALAGAGVNEVVVVLGHYADAIESVVSDYSVKRVRNLSPDDGQPSSLRIGLQALEGKLDALIIALADQPMIDADDIAVLIDAFTSRRANGNCHMVVPRIAGEPGNPVIIDAAVKDEWLQGDINAAGRHWRESNPERVHWFDTNNNNYRVDIDTPQDIERFAAKTSHSLRWPDQPV